MNGDFMLLVLLLAAALFCFGAVVKHPIGFLFLLGAFYFIFT